LRTPWSGAYDQVRAIARDLGDRGTSCGYVALRDQSAEIEQAASDHVADALTHKLEELRELISRIQAGIQRDESSP
jgi:predicted small metal-binding protein